LHVVDKVARPCEHFVGVVHVDDTTSLSLKEAIESVLVSHGLTLTSIRGQGYEAFTCMPLKKDGVNLCATKKIAHTCVPST
jgi:hypothetical protein